MLYYNGLIIKIEEHLSAQVQVCHILLLALHLDSLVTDNYAL